MGHVDLGVVDVDLGVDVVDVKHLRVSYDKKIWSRVSSQSKNLAAG